MVLLTMTASMVDGLEKLQSLEKKVDEDLPVEEKSLEDEDEGKTKEGHEAGNAIDSGEEEPAKATTHSAEPSLSNPKLGNPISHGQVMDLSRDLRARGMQPNGLEALLRGSRVYAPPPAPKAEPTSEYKALMARLRREEEARSYERMTNPPPPMETFNQRFPSASAAHAFSSSYQNIQTSDPDDDGLTYADVDRQMALILNVLLSIVACAAAIWVAARWWNTPARLALSMSGSLLVGVAEVVVYSGYIRRVGEAKGKEKGVKEVKKIVKTWVVAAGEKLEEDDTTSISIESTHVLGDNKARRRKIDTS